MSALSRLMIAGVAAALLSAPVAASEYASAKLEAGFAASTTAQQDCRGWGVRCDVVEVTPEFCIAADKCALALPGSMLVRYDQHMDTVLGR